MLAALAAEEVLAADETPVNVLDKTAPRPRRAEEEEADPEEKDGKAAAGRAARADRPHPGRAADVAAGPRLPAKGAVAAGDPGRVHRVPDHRRLHRLPAPPVRGSPASSSAASTSSAAAAPSRSSAPAACSPGPATSSTILREAHQAVEEARARGDTALDAELSTTCANATTQAAAFGITHNRLRDWHDGNHPGYALGCWLRDYKEQVFLFTRDFAVDWTNNVSERGAKAAKRHQAVSGYWHTLAHPRPLVPHPQLPRLRRRPRHHRTRRHPRRHSPENPGYRHSPPLPDTNSRHP